MSAEALPTGHAVILEAGSNGTSISVYKWTRDIEMIIKQVERLAGPKLFGKLGDIGQDGISIDSYLLPILEDVKSLIPQSVDSTPVILLATEEMKQFREQEKTLYEAVKVGINSAEHTNDIKLRVQEYDAKGVTDHIAVITSFLEMFVGYAVILEAKSSETRIFVYKWTRTDGVEKLSIKPIKRSIEPEKPFQKKGDISEQNADSVGLYLRFMLADAHGVLPENAGTIPVFLVATDRMQKLKGKEKLYKAVKNGINSAKYTNGTTFKMREFTPKSGGVDTDHFAILNGFFEMVIKYAVILAAGPKETRIFAYKYKKINNIIAPPRIEEVPLLGNKPGKGVHELIPDETVDEATKTAAINDVNSHLQPMLHDAHELLLGVLPQNTSEIPLFFLTTAEIRGPEVTPDVRYTILNKAAKCAIDSTKYKLYECNTIPEDNEEGIMATYPRHHDILCRYSTTFNERAVILDAGSSGTRIFLYTWEGSLDVNGEAVLPGKINLPHGWDTKKSEIKPGIHELAPKTATEIAKKAVGTSKTAAEITAEIAAQSAKTAAEIAVETAKGVKSYLDTLFQYTHSVLVNDAGLPIDISSVRLFLLATGGMRRLKQTDYEGYKILRKAITDYINGSGFWEPEYSAISGEDEGLFGWVAVNYLTGRFHSKEDTRGFMEMGGQSAQIAFRPDEADKSKYKGSLTRVKVGGRLFDVFTKTWPMLGADAVWKRHEEKLRESDTVLVHDPCLPRGYSYRLPDSDKTIVGTGDLIECTKETFLLLGCEDEQCLAGRLCVYRGRGCLLKNTPGLGFEKETRQFCGASVYWHATNGVFGAEKESGNVNRSAEGSYDLVAFWNEAKALFSQDWAKIKAARPREKETNYMYLQKAFFKAGLIMSTLHLGFGVPMPGLASEAVREAVREYVREAVGTEAEADESEAAIKVVEEAIEKAVENAWGKFGSGFVGALPSMGLDAVLWMANGNGFGAAGKAVKEAVKQAVKEAVSEFVKEVGKVEVGETASDAVKNAVELFRDEAMKAEPSEAAKKAAKKAGSKFVSEFVSRTAWVDVREAAMEAAKKAAHEFISVFVKEATMVGKEVADGKFTTVKEASWTLGKIVLCAVGSDPQVRTCEGWKEPTSK